MKGNLPGKMLNKENEMFRFKQFCVRQSFSAMKVNTDGVLLGAWVSLDKAGSECRVLDIGTGTGVISLILAQRLSGQNTINSFFVEAIDVDKLSSEEAAYNFSCSPWHEKLLSEWISLQDYYQENGEKKFDIIVSNPPFFTGSLKAPGRRRSVARHNDDLPYELIIRSSYGMLKDSGVLAVVLPAEESEIFISCARKEKMTLERLCKIKTLSDRKEKRYLMEFALTGETLAVREEQLVIQEIAGKEFTPQYKNLTKDFYLNF
jgi:tRNA1Val (adenine37-N6)-methyltransferase